MMIDMFTNYQNLSDSYIPNNLSEHKCKPQSYTKLYPVENSKPYELYNAKGELEGYFWSYGDTINLEFTIEGEVTLNPDSYITAEDFLKDKFYAIKLYDFRFKEIYTQVGQASTNVILSIDKDLSNRLVKGTYHCSLDITSTDFNKRLFDPQDCKLLVR